MDEIEQRIQNTFTPAQQNLNNMKTGLSWLWSNIYSLLILILTPVEKGINWLIGNNDSDTKGEDWF